MRIRSLRLKISIFSVLLAGAVMMLSLFYQARLSMNVFRNMMGQGTSILMEGIGFWPPPFFEWDTIKKDLVTFYGIKEKDIGPFFMVLNQAGEVEYQFAKQGRDFSEKVWPLERLGVEMKPHASFVDTSPPVGPASESTLKAREGYRAMRQEMVNEDRSVWREIQSVTKTIDGLKWEITCCRTANHTLLIGVAYFDFYRDQFRFTFILLLCMPLVLVLMGGVGWVLAHTLLRPVRYITETTRRIAESEEDERIVFDGRDRVWARLVGVLNDMLDRLQAEFLQSTRFSEDSARELAAPLENLRNGVQQAWEDAGEDAESKALYEDLMGEVGHLQSIIDKLMLLSQADTGKLHVTLTLTDLSGLVETLSKEIEHLAPGIRVSSKVEPGVLLHADASLLRQVFNNLATNAVKYNVDVNPKIRLSLDVRGEMAHFTLANTGHPIPAEKAQWLFKRFYRLESDRNRKKGGTGLGLSLAQEVVEAHDGMLEVDLSTPGWVAFHMRLPMIRQGML